MNGIYNKWKHTIAHKKQDGWGGGGEDKNSPLKLHYV